MSRGSLSFAVPPAKAGTPTRGIVSGRWGGRGFTLVELLVVVAIIALLGSLIAAVVQRGLEGGRRATCGQNLRNLVAANQAHADATGTYVSAGEDLMTTNRRRWHGVRKGGNQPFDPALGPLATYLGGDGRVQACPSFRPGRDFTPGFETSNGGYGYNAIGIGSTSYLGGFNARSFRTGLAPAAVDAPTQVIMFTDAAFGQPYGSPDHLIEYSFAEPVRHLAWNSTREDTKAIPSIHFRHADRANVIWADGHLTAEAMNPTAAPAVTKWKLGWFGSPPDNTPFRPF